MKFPVGKSDFKAIINEGFTFVDKTLFISDIINDDSEISLITRPRRFGKTLNLSMLYYFFSNQNSAVHAKLFAGLKIEQEASLFTAYQGMHPVIYLSLKDVQANDFERAYMTICGLVQELYGAHDAVLESDKINEVEKAIFTSLMKKAGDIDNVSKSLRFLSHCLYKHYGQKVIMLIDEYDAPILGNPDHYFAEMISFMRSF